VPLTVQASFAALFIVVALALHGDRAGAGFYLEVMPSGARYWRLKFRFGGKEKRLALGVFPEVSLPWHAQTQMKRGNFRLPSKEVGTSLGLITLQAEPGMFQIGRHRYVGRRR